MNVSMVVNVVVFNNNSSLKKKMMVNESHAPTETSFVAKSHSTSIVVPARSPYT